MRRIRAPSEHRDGRPDAAFLRRFTGSGTGICSSVADEVDISFEEIQDRRTDRSDRPDIVVLEEPSDSAPRVTERRRGDAGPPESAAGIADDSPRYGVPAVAGRAPVPANASPETAVKAQPWSRKRPRNREKPRARGFCIGNQAGSFKADEGSRRYSHRLHLSRTHRCSCERTAVCSGLRR